MPVAPRIYAVNIRLTEDERKRIESAALGSDRKLSDYIRQAALEAARKAGKGKRL